MAFVLRGGSVKNKIILCLSFCFILFIGLNFVSAASFTIDDVTYDVPEFDSYIESSKFYIIYRRKDSTQVKLQYIPSDNTVYDVVKMEYNGAETYNLTGYGSDGVYSRAYTCSYNLDTNEFKAWSTSTIQPLTDITLGEVYACSMDIYNTDGSIYFSSAPQDDTIGNPNSDLQLSYEYNEDFTECHIDATLKNGAFTDKIYYSEYPFGVDGTLKTKKGFPVERYNNFWK